VEGGEGWGEWKDEGQGMVRRTAKEEAEMIRELSLIKIINR